VRPVSPAAHEASQRRALRIARAAQMAPLLAATPSLVRAPRAGTSLLLWLGLGLPRWPTPVRTRSLGSPARAFVRRDLTWSAPLSTQNTNNSYNNHNNNNNRNNSNNNNSNNSKQQARLVECRRVSAAIWPRTPPQLLAS
ncbi:unnamed protein product, partial [Polarella glacialis]